MAISSGHDDIAELIQAVQLSQTSAHQIKVATTHTEETNSSTQISEKIDNRTMAILNKAMEDMLVAKAKTFILAQDKSLDRNLPPKPSRIVISLSSRTSED